MKYLNNYPVVGKVRISHAVIPTFIPTPKTIETKERPMKSSLPPSYAPYPQPLLLLLPYMYIIEKEEGQRSRTGSLLEWDKSPIMDIRSNTEKPMPADRRIAS